MIPAWLTEHAVRIAVYGGLLLLYTLVVWVHGYAHGEQKLFAYKVEVATQAIKLVTKQGATTEKVVTKYVKVRETAEPVVQAIHEKVLVYALTPQPAVLDASHCLAPQWRVLHDAAATNTIPPSASAADGEGEAPTAAAALSTVTANYAEHNACVDRLDALQEWVAEQQKLNPK